MFHCCFDSHSFQMIFNRFLARFISIHLAGRITRDRIHMNTPMVQNHRNMFNILWVFNTAEHQIVILGTIIFCPKSSDAFYNFCLNYKKMCNIIMWAEQIHAEIRFKVRIIMLFSISRNLILICIQNIIFLFLQCIYYFI